MNHTPSNNTTLGTGNGNDSQPGEYDDFPGDLPDPPQDPVDPYDCEELEYDGSGRDRDDDQDGDFDDEYDLDFTGDDPYDPFDDPDSLGDEAPVEDDDDDEDRKLSYWEILTVVLAMLR